MKNFPFCFLCAVLCFHLFANQISSVSAQNSPIKLLASTVLKDLIAKNKQNPKLSAKMLADFANSVLAKKGFNYEFDICELLRAKNEVKQLTEEGELLIFPYVLKLSNSRKATFQISISKDADAPCGECFTGLPAIRVTEKQVVFAAEGKTYIVTRTKFLMLDEAALVDSATMRKEIRKWHFPFQTVSIGVSPDGKKIYLDVPEFELDEEFSELDKLALEIDEFGNIKFHAKSELNLKSKGVELKNFLKEKGNDYLGSIHFKSGNKSYIVKFTNPCA